VPESPRVIVRSTSASVGSVPEGVERNLYTPVVKSRGGGVSSAAAGPSPRPSAPCQTAQCAR
jgi:hypothetical protein